ncbi:hypothetical protein MSAR_08040 [Mycolicibacterium sarraceniae]|uniref:Uncharacterized protein n=1 Tax=Mycolicibacterium sarraceniae TaxID=1534348 RepID=A0A7I7SLM2_9MYCO|nr:hypothetical protein MSAR_08040 [Mycolicibacterium sarraceniae]
MATQRKTTPLPADQRRAALHKAGAVPDWQTAPPGHAAAIWARRGELFGVHASGNAPGVHGLWPQALAMGYRVAVRPSRREPFTAHQLVAALCEAGFREDDVTYLPTDHAGADEIIAAADLGDGSAANSRQPALSSPRHGSSVASRSAGTEQHFHHRVVVLGQIHVRRRSPRWASDSTARCANWRDRCRCHAVRHLDVIVAAADDAHCR